MTRAEQILARRYATAFLNVFGDSIDFDAFMAINEAKMFFAERKKVLYFLSLSTLASSEKARIMKQVFTVLDLPESFNILLTLLLHDKRAGLLYDVLQFIVKIYEQRNKIMDFTCTTSHEVDKKALEIMKRFLAQQTGNDIIYTYQIDKDLIAGIRLQSDTLLWEQSVEKQLRTISLSLIP